MFFTGIRYRVELVSALENIGILKILLIFFTLLFSKGLQAEGSKDLITNGGYRAYVASTLNPLNTSASTAASYPFPTLGTFKVYVKAGETLYLGSSAQGIGIGKIIARAPNGAVYNSGAGTDGRINDLQEEQNGPDLAPFSDNTRYKPFIVPVSAGQEGVWEIDFVSPDPDNVVAGSNSPSRELVTYNWSGQQDNTIYVTAFDITVRNAANTAFINGRAFANVFNGYLASFQATFNSKFNVITKDGYIYEVNNNGHAGNGFTFFVNNKGFRDGAGNATYKSHNTSTNPPVYDPRAVDSGTDVTHKIFFNQPNVDLPATAATPGGGTTWLKTEPVSPSATDLLFKGMEGTLYKGGTSPLGGYLTFTSNQAIPYIINLDINKNGSFADAVDVTFTGTALIGNNSIYWNGLNGQGNAIARAPGQTISFSPANAKVTLRGGEVHFPFIDVENNVNGIVITRKNGVNPNTDEVYWDDSDITYSAGHVPSNPIVSTGISSASNGHKFGSVATNEDGLSFGNVKGLDTWTYVISSPANPLMNIQLQEADLEVMSLVADKTTYCVNEEITYTVKLRNNGPDHVTGARFALNYPAGFTFVSIGSAQTTGVSSIYNNSSNATQFTAAVDLQDDAVLTLTIKGKMNTAGNLSTVSASIMRPADVTDPDATNPDSAIPVDPTAECNAAPSGNGCNNIKTAASVTITTKDITIQNTVVTEGTGGVRKITFPVSIPTSAGCNISVDYTITHTSTSAADFDATTAFSGTITIPAGSTSVNLEVFLNTDKIIETNEVFTVTLNNPIGGALNIATATGTITNDDEVEIAVTKTDGGETGSVSGSFIFGFSSGVTSDVPTDIDYVLAGTAVAGTDYAANSGTITIPAGANSVTLMLPVVDDAIVEGDETVTIALTRMLNAHDGTPVNTTPVTPVVNIADNDTGSLTLSSDVEINESNSGTVTATFTLTLDKAIGRAITLNYNTVDGTATTADNDYGSSGSVQLAFDGINAGDSKTITININGDVKMETDELLQVVLSNLSDNFSNRLSIPFISRNITIKNDDIAQITISKTNGEEGVQGGSFLFSYLPGFSSDIPVTINYTLLGSATAAADYTHAFPSSGSIVIPAGVNSVPLLLPVTDDAIVEGTETVQIVATAATNPYGTVIANSPVTLDILDNDFGVVSISPATIIEGHSGTSVARFKVKVNSATGSDFRLPYSTTNGTATTSDLDYVAPAPGSFLSFSGAAGQELDLDIVINGDKKIEASEVFNVLLGTLNKTFENRLSVQTDHVLATIPNDDTGVVTVSKTDGAETGSISGSFVFSFPPGVSSDQPTTLNFTLSGTADRSGADIDYVPSVNNSIIIPAGANSATLTLAVNDDNIMEDNESVILGGVTLISVHPGISVNPVFPIVTIVDNDDAQLLLSGPTELNEGNNGISTATFTVTLDKRTNPGFSVDYVIVDGTAQTGDTDYVSGAGTLLFLGNAGETQTISLKINGDTKIEPNENLTVKLLPLTSNFNGRLTVPATQAVFSIKNDDNPAITIHGSDGFEGSHNGSFTFKFPAGVVSTDPTVINYVTSGSTGGGVDFAESSSGTVTIPAGQNSVDLPISVVNDLIVESTEVLQITASVQPNAYGITVANSPASISIFDNDEATLSITGPATIVEGNAGTSIATFEVKLSHQTSSGFSINYTTQNGTASAGSDYIANTGTLNFDGLVAGQTRTVQVIINGDMAIEPDETFSVLLQTLTNTFGNRLKLGASLAGSHILNDDGGDIYITTVDGAETGTVPGKFIFSFPPGVTSPETTTIKYSLSGSALVAEDYTDGLNGSITIPAGTNSVTLTLPVIDDVKVEDTEHVSLTVDAIININGLVAANTFRTLALADNDVATLTLASPAPLLEGHSGTVDAVFTVTLDKATRPFSLSYSSADVSAQIANSDYNPLSGPALQFLGNAGESHSITLKINGDRLIEADEIFNLNLGSPSNTFNNRLTVPVSLGTATIKNDDAGAITITKADGEEGVQGGAFVFSLPAGTTSDIPLVINYSLSGTASAGGTDYQGASPGTITLPIGSNSVTLNLPVIDDNLVEDTERITISAAISNNAYGVTIVNSTLSLDILDNDQTTITVSDASIVEGDNGTSILKFQVKLNKGVGSNFTVPYSISDGTATLSDNDYVASLGTGGSLSFDKEMVQTKEISVVLNGDKKIEADETFVVKLGAPSVNFGSRLTIPDSEATGTITNDDAGEIIITTTDGSENGPSPGSFIFSFANNVVSDKPTTIHYKLSGTAGANGIDYAAPSSASIIIPAGANSVALNLPVIDDNVIEDLEKVEIEITSFQSNNASFLTLNPNMPALQIADNDFGLLSLSGPVTHLEGNSGTTSYTFTVTLEKPTGGPFSVFYTAKDGSATLADNDYVSTGLVRLDFSGAAETKTITVDVRGDVKIESNETFDVELNGLTNSFANRLTIHDSPSTATIENDDEGKITVTKKDGTEGGQNASFTFAFPVGITSSAPTIVTYSLAGTASTADYNAQTSNNITIPAGANSFELVLPIIDDNDLEEAETLALSIINVSNTHSNVQWNLPLPTLSIFDNDKASLTISSPLAILEGNSGTKTITFTVKLDKHASRNFDINYSTANATATVTDNDYQAKAGKLMFTGFAGEAYDVTVPINGDVKVEANEAFNLVLSGLTFDFGGRLTVQGNPGTATITNDDVLPLAKPDMIITPEDTPVMFSIIANDVDADGIAANSISLKSFPVKGSLVANPDGTVKYTPQLNDFGTYQFTYTVKDVFGLESNIATVTIQVTPMNDPPIAEDDVFYVTKNVSFSGNVSTNDKDPDSDVLSFRLLSSPGKGVLQFFNTSDGRFVYTPGASFAGKDVFTYEVKDPSGLTDMATVVLNIQPQVTVSLTPLTAERVEGDTITVTAVLTDVLLQDAVITLGYNGTAELTKDYLLAGNHQTITIPAGSRTTTQRILINTIRDYLKEPTETINVNISAASPSAFVSIGSGAQIMLNNFYPEIQVAPPHANNDINPDPLTSPNGDGLGNEKFVIHNIENFPNNEVIIFNRWGNEVFRLSGYDNLTRSFTGVANSGPLANSNTPLVDGVYYFLIHTKLPDGSKKLNKGFVIVKR